MPMSGLSNSVDSCTIGVQVHAIFCRLTAIKRTVLG